MRLHQGHFSKTSNAPRHAALINRLSANRLIDSVMPGRAVGDASRTIRRLGEVITLGLGVRHYCQSIPLWNNTLDDINIGAGLCPRYGVGANQLRPLRDPASMGPRASSYLPGNRRPHIGGKVCFIRSFHESAFLAAMRLRILWLRG